MYRNRDAIRNFILYISDMLTVLVSYIVSNVIRFGIVKGIDLPTTNGIFNNIGIVLFSAAFVIFIFNVNRDFMRRGYFEELLYCFKINLLFASVYAVCLFVSRNMSTTSRGMYATTIIMNIVLMYVLHLLLKNYFQKIYIHRKKNTQMFIITSSDRAEKVIKDLENNADFLNKICGIAIIDRDSVGSKIGDVKVVANKESMIEYIKHEFIDEVFIDIPKESNDLLRKYIMTMQNMGIAVHLNIEILHNFDEFNKSLSMVGDIPVVTFANKFYDANKLMIKRLMDIVGSIIGIIITLIVTVFLAPVLLIESRGPLIFRQKRVGKNGRYFYIYKFRSMYRDAEERKKALMAKNEMNGLMFKMTDDPRVTKVGKFIRKTSIDELPQFVNVLFGDMSLVGTRPPTVDEFKQYESYHKRRLSFKPGLTGMWQVSGRSNIDDFEEVVKLDLQYIDNWSIGMDIKIILKTIGVIFVRKGAK